MEYGLSEKTRLRIDEFHYENTYGKLTATKGGLSESQALFGKMADLFSWAAILGYLEGKPVEIKKKASNTTVEWNYVSEPHKMLLVAMAIESEKSFELLNDPKALQKNIEEYSNAGLDIIHREMNSDPIAYTDIESLIYHIQKRVQARQEK